MTDDEVPPPDDDAAPLPRGAIVGRYEIRGVLGQGGMGVVYAAYDPQLDRKVALKLLRRDVYSGEQLADGRARLLREAQAMARLSHPNVVSVFDAGTFHDQLFVAMELVDGMTLRRWLTTETVAHADIIASFVAAARGLAAAHAVGLVHRDFKPENVLRSTAGRICVADFGLAHSAPGAGGAQADSSPRAFSGDPLGIRMTQSGTLLGTPAYMAPEQLDGDRADERTDQYSFCVALYEALYGEPPFVGATFTELAEEVMNGRVRAAPAGSRVPDKLRQLLLKGLARSPAERHASMETLIDALSPRPHTRRRVLVGASIGVAALLGLAGYEARRPTQLCRGADRKLSGVWDDATKGAIHAAFSATKRAYAESAWDKTAQALDAYTQAWVSMRTDACEATHVRGEQSPQLLDLRMACLDDRLRDTAALTSALAHADGDDVERAGAIVQTLPPLLHCADTQQLSSRTPLPADEGTRAQLDALGSSIAQVRTLMAAGKNAEALKLVGPLAAIGEHLHYPPLSRDALSARGRIEMASGELPAATATLKSALLVAESAGEDERVVMLWNDLMRAYVEQNDLDQAAQALQHAQAFLKRLPDREGLQGELDYTTGVMSTRAGQYDAARSAFVRSLAVVEKRSGKVSRDASRVLGALSTCALIVGNGPEALSWATRAVEVDEKLLGPDHPDLVNDEETLGNALAAMNRQAEASAAYRRGLDIAQRSLPPDDPMVANALGNWGGALAAEKRYPEALVAFEQALAIQRKHEGEDGATVGQTLSNIGAIEIDAKRLDEAQKHLELALGIKEHSLGPEHDEVGKTLVLLANVANARKDGARAEQMARRAIAIFDKTVGPTSLDLSDAYEAAGEAALALDQPRKAVIALEHALAIRAAQPHAQKPQDAKPGDPGESPDVTATRAALEDARKRARTVR